MTRPNTTLIALALLLSTSAHANRIPPASQDASIGSQAAAGASRTPPPHTPGASSADGLLAAAKASLSANDLLHADTALRQYLAAKPDSSEAMYLLGHTLQRENQPKESLQWFTKAASLSTPTGEDLRIVAMNYVLLNDYADAIHWLERSVVARPQNAEAWYDLGRAWMTQGDYTAAEKALLRATSLRPKFVKAENNLGLVYEAQNHLSQAAEAYQQALAWQESDPRPSEQPLLNYGTLLVTQQRAAEALPMLARAVEIAPGNAKAHEQLAHAQEQQGQLPEAQEQMRKAIEIEPGNAAFHYQLGQLYRRSGETEKGRQEIQLSSKLYGTHSSTPNH